MTVQSTSSATCLKKAAPSPFSSPLKISRTRSGVMAISISPSFAASTGLDVVEQFHQILDLDVFERTHGILDLPAQALVNTAGHELVELLHGLFPSEGVGSE